MASCITCYAAVYFSCSGDFHMQLILDFILVQIWPQWEARYVFSVSPLHCIFDKCVARFVTNSSPYLRLRLHRVGALSVDGRCLCPSLCLVPYPKSRTGGRIKAKIGWKEAHDTSDPWQRLEIERSNICREILAPHSLRVQWAISVYVLWPPALTELWVAQGSTVPMKLFLDYNRLVVGCWYENRLYLFYLFYLFNL